MKLVITLGSSLLVLYSVICAAAFVLQRSLLYFPPDTYVSPADVNLPDMQDIEIVANTTSWWMPPSADDKNVVLFFHGNGSAVFSNRDIFSDLIAQGHGVLSVGYPGYPYKGMTAKSPESKPTQDSIVKAASENYQFVLGKNIDPDRIVFFGTSLGSGVASQLAAQYKPALLILDAPFNSTLDMGKRRMPFLPVSLLMKDKFESDKALENYNGPLICIHGTADPIIPLSQGQKLYDGYDGPKTAHIIEGGNHVNLWDMGGREIILQRLAALTP